MNYELKSAKAMGLPYDKKENPNNPNSPVIYGINVIIRTGIVGQVYPGFMNQDVSFCSILKTDSIDQITEKINQHALNFVAEKYPKT